MKILLLHYGGQTSFDSETILGYGSLENLISSDILNGIPNREKSLGDLWEAANLPEVPLDPPVGNEESPEE